MNTKTRIIPNRKTVGDFEVKGITEEESVMEVEKKLKEEKKQERVYSREKTPTTYTPTHTTLLPSGEILNQLKPFGILGTCGLFEERQVGDERFNVFESCPVRKTATIILRDGSEQFIAESERSIHDALMVVFRSIKSGSVVAGGGAVEMEVSHYLRNYSLGIKGKGQLMVAAVAKALEIIPRQLDNAGFDSTDILSALRKQHAIECDESSKWYGVNINDGGICDTFALGVWEPSLNKCNSISAAAEAACVILSIDETVGNPRSQDPGAQSTGMMGGGGQPMTNMMGNVMNTATSGDARSGQLGPGVSYMKGRGG